MNALSIYENGVDLNELYYDQVGDIALDNRGLVLQGKIDESAIDLQSLATMNVIDFLLAISPIKKNCYLENVSVCSLY
ncbi:hypothetical protein CN567_22215 [Bacillus toyonensis]|uniref:Uncharacterized protein n=1 Tax=Bacillus toyonensis TaxID=155322 RepID=A0AB36T7E9_9BACI|nr:hypothetical protein [Bacillus toyonensis]PEC09880.1 hypothetical protein CON55_16045 [Bacillus toyonensis]PEN90164.1 hypothetical protein CN551_07455 [Bacillus toyonensis]PEO60916.1 hypothetical protein CN567_22215 [Bacillus toyonensis]PFX72607.1 hypothetical protein COL37_28805 [Bacillus toyonensis]PFX78930.1 hypothetical protein COL38_21160 [Bacillus toyonensis]